MRFLLMAGMLLACVFAAHGANVDVTGFVRRDSFGDIKISPTGEYYAASVPGEDKSILMVLRRVDNKVMGGFSLGRNTYIADFEWVNAERLVFGTARKFGALDQPQLTGNLYAMNADGSGKDILVGQDVVTSAGTHIQTKKAEMVAAFLLDTLADDERNVLVRISGFEGDGYSRVEKMDAYSGRRVLVARAPVRNADFVADPAGVVRFAYGRETDNDNKLFYRDVVAGDPGRTSDWRELNDEATSGHIEVPLGFSADGRVAYLQVEQASGPDAIVAYDTRDGSRRTVLRDEVSDPGAIIRGLGTTNGVPAGAFFDDGRPRTAFFDEDGAEARLYRSLEAAFAGKTVQVTSTTSDGRLALVQVSSDRDAGEFYLFDTIDNKAGYLLSRRDWQDPETMAEVRPIALKARDGLPLHGYLTLPRGSSGTHLPLVVLPHGGPYVAGDAWAFNPEAQLLAAAGYAVLQVNFRGTSGYGRAFSLAGARQWGGAMQDDVTDATRWAIAQGVADPARVCIFGASYGGYAALMGVAKEQGLYKCAAGYVGVYDLPLLYSAGDTRLLKSGKNYLRDWVGEPAELVGASPVNLATRIKVPVFLAAGGEDERAPILHSERMEKALRAAGVPVETLYFPTEGHGFYTDEHQRAFYAQLLAFLDRNIGVPAGSAAAAASP